MTSITASDSPEMIDPTAIRSYEPSWAHRLNDWVEALPGPSLFYYLCAWLCLYLIMSGVKWYEHVYPFGTFSSLHAIVAGIGIYALALLHFLRYSGHHALQELRPALDIDEAEYRALDYRFTVTPARQTLVATVLAILGGIIIALAGRDYWVLGQFSTTPVASVVDWALALFAYGAYGVVLFRTWHEFVLLQKLLSHHTRINLFHLEPIYAIARYAGRASIGGSLILMAIMLTFIPAGILREPLAIAFVAILNPLVILLFFIWPFLGIHDRLEREKFMLKEDLTDRLNRLLKEVNQCIDERVPGKMAELGSMIDMVVKEQGIIDKISTWPWQPSTLQGVASALITPSLLWVISRILEKVLSGITG